MSYERLGVHHLSDAPDTYVAILQYPGLDVGPAVLVAPLLQSDDLIHIPFVTVQVEFLGSTYLLATHQITAIPSVYIGHMVGNLMAYEYDISRALSRIFFGN
jgi:toxin CcdB